jgi:heme oxygenase
LERLYWVHTTFESEVARCPELAAVWPAEATRAPAIIRDLAVWGAAFPPVVPDAVSDWHRKMLLRGAPSVWAGVGYVLEGSRMGSRMLAAPLSRALGVPPGPGVGLDYHREGLAEPLARWQRVRTAIEMLDGYGANRKHIVFGAVSTFELMLIVHAEPACVPEPFLQPALL